MSENRPAPQAQSSTQASGQPAPPHRRPNPKYRGTNGFFDHALVSPADDRPSTGLLGGDAMQTDNYPDEATRKTEARRRERKLWDAIERHREADEVLDARGQWWPGMDAARAELATEETSASMQERITGIQKNYHAEMQRLYDLLAEDYLGEAADAYYSVDDTMSLHEVDHLISHHRRPDTPHLTPLYTTLSDTRYAHFHTLHALHRKRKDLLTAEDTARRLRDAQFPTSLEAYRAIQNRDVQVRIARFLVADQQVKDRMISQFGWVWRMCKPLMDAYTKDAAFKAEIQERVRDLDVRDPRQRTTSAA